MTLIPLMLPADPLPLPMLTCRRLPGTFTLLMSPTRPLKLPTLVPPKLPIRPAQGDVGMVGMLKVDGAGLVMPGMLKGDGAGLVMPGMFIPGIPPGDPLP